MLRFLFEESKREDTGPIHECNEVIKQFTQQLHLKAAHRALSPKFYRLELTAQAFTRALDELEQSIYCSHRFSKGFIQQSMIEISEEQIDCYHRYLYFYKDGFIRIFSILDKLGYFMNDMFELRTERVKPKFSYFTVLRQLNKTSHFSLVEELQQWKFEYRAPMQRLRKKRNMEIHYINVELMDDLLLQQNQSLDAKQIDDLAENNVDLDQGFAMVCRSLYSVFSYSAEQWK